MTCLLHCYDEVRASCPHRLNKSNCKKRVFAVLANEKRCAVQQFRIWPDARGISNLIV
jgi:hypothetical protein